MCDLKSFTYKKHLSKMTFLGTRQTMEKKKYFYLLCRTLQCSFWPMALALEPMPSEIKCLILALNVRMKAKTTSCLFCK